MEMRLSPAPDCTASETRRPMNIGVYVNTLQPASPASQRFQETILEGLQQLNVPQFHFIVLSEAIPPEFKDGPQIRYAALARPSAAERIMRRCRLFVGGVVRRSLRLLGAGESSPYKRVTDWLAYEPPYFRQLRELNIRLIWNVGIHVLDAFVPFIMTVWDSNHRTHSMFPEFSYVSDGKKLHERFTDFDRPARFLNRASFIIVGTERGKQELIEAFGAYPGKVRVIPFPTPALPGREECGPTAERPPYVFYPGRFWPHKNQVVLVHALKLLRDRWGIVLHCVFSGIDNGNLSYVMRTAEQLGVREQIEYLGNVPLKQLAELYRNAMALVFCSALGPDNFPPLEAMSVGCPVITTDIPGAREAYGDAAIFFSPTNENHLAECIKALLDDSTFGKV